LLAADLGLVADIVAPFPAAAGGHGAARRGLAPGLVLEVELPVPAELRPEEFDERARLTEAHFGARIQAPAPAWTLPYAVACISLFRAPAPAPGLEAALGQRPCGRNRASTPADPASSRPFGDSGLRLSMLLA
jgi:hypothetical protein